MLVPKTWSYSAKEGRFIVNCEGIVDSRVTLVARLERKGLSILDDPQRAVGVWKSTGRRNPTFIVRLAIEQPRKGMKVHAWLYEGDKRVSSMTVSVPVVTCPHCNEVFLL